MRVEAQKYNSVLKRAEIYEISVKLVTLTVIIVTLGMVARERRGGSDGADLGSTYCLSEANQQDISKTISGR